MHFAKTNAAVELVLQSSKGQLGMQFALSSAAEHWCWVPALVYEESLLSGCI